jgi:hypothetical protein
VIFKLPTRPNNPVPDCLLTGGEMKLNTLNVELEAVVYDPEISCPLYGLIFKIWKKKVIYTVDPRTLNGLMFRGKSGFETQTKTRKSNKESRGH